jgi:hypothetical protein
MRSPVKFDGRGGGGGYQPRAQISNHQRACTQIGGFHGLGEPWKDKGGDGLMK